MASSFLAELKRRNVYRVGVGYAAAMFVALQAAEILLSGLGENDRLFRLLVVLALAGFPVALILAWLFDITPEGVMRTEATETDLAPPSRAWQLLWIGALSVSALLVGGTGWWFLRASAGEVSAVAANGAFVDVNALDTRSLVVVPFANLSGDDSEEYFSDGMTDAVITGLARVRGLSVTARTSAFALKDSPKSHAEIASELGVSSILEGSVRKSGDAVRVDVHLADARSGFEMWTERYERPVTDVFAVQDEIAQAIVRVLEVTLAERPDGDLVEAPTANPMAYDKFLWGEYNRNKRTPEGLRDAVANYEEGIEQDPEYGGVHAGLAQALIALAGTPRQPRDELMQRAEASLERALELDPDLASAHAARGILLFEYKYNWNEAEAQLRQAVELEPQSAEIRQLLARVLSVRGKTEEALSEAATAVRLDRLSPGALADEAVVLHAAGRAEAALARYDQALALDPSFEEARRGRGFVLLALGRGEEASRELRPPTENGAGGPVGGGPPGGPEGDRSRRPDPGSPEGLDEIVSRFRARAADGSGAVGAANFLAPLLALNGRSSEAVELLESAYASRTLEPLELVRALAVDGFRQNQAAQDFLAEIGLQIDN